MGMNGANVSVLAAGVGGKERWLSCPVTAGAGLELCHRLVWATCAVQSLPWGLLPVVLVLLDDPDENIILI